MCCNTFTEIRMMGWLKYKCNASYVGRIQHSGIRRTNSTLMMYTSEIVGVLLKYTQCSNPMIHSYFIRNITFTDKKKKKIKRCQFYHFRYLY